MEEISIDGLTAGAGYRSKETAGPGGQKPGANEEQLKKACADFEAIFINYMMKSMRSTIPQNSDNNFPGKDIYATMADQKVAEDLAKNKGGMGLQEMLLRQLGGTGIRH
jgi:peptidoglycan hydrolase FlgJ